MQSTRLADSKASGSAGRRWARERSRFAAACTVISMAWPSRCVRSGSSTLAEAGAQLLLVFLLTSREPPRQVLERLPTVLGDGSDEAHVAAVAELALLEDDDDLALQPAPQVRWTSLGDELGPAFAQAREPILEDRLDELLLRTEVVEDRRVVSATDVCADLSHRHTVDAVIGDQSFSSEQDLFFGGLRRGGHRRISSGSACAVK